MTQVFLSHSTDDNYDFVSHFASDLRGAGLVVWKAPDSILPGEGWVQAIQRGLMTSSHFILVISPRAVESDWVNFEFENAVMLEKRQRLKIIPVRYEYCETPLFWDYYQAIDLADYDMGINHIIDRVETEKPAFPPEPTDPESTIINLAKSGRKQGSLNTAALSLIHLRPDAPPVAAVLEPDPEPEPDPNYDPVFDILPQPFDWCEIPQGGVTIKGQYLSVPPFKMAKFPVTYAQYKVFFIAADGYFDDHWWKGLAYRPKKPGVQRWSIASHPRENVCWYEAVAFTRWLTHKVGYQVSLPAEWQWQWAAAGDTGWDYPYGPEFDPTNCNGGKKGNQQTTPVDTYRRGNSPFGVMDMSGNVWEWCLNESEDIKKTALTGSNKRVLRGGSWSNTFAQDVRVTSRFGGSPHKQSLYDGFRIATTI